MKLSGKVALVTGASSGIGEAVAAALARRGARLTLVARRRRQLDALAGRLRDRGGEALVEVADVRSEPDLIGAFDRSQERWGRLDILINNAGIGRSAAFLSGDTADWRAMFEVNVLAVAVAAREALKRFDAETGGHIVNIASMSGHRVPPKGGFYAVTKHAVRAMTEALRLELRGAANPSRVSAISPGFVSTEFVQGYREEDRKRMQETMDRIRVLSPEDVALSVVHILEAPDHVAIHDVLIRSNDQLT